MRLHTPIATFEYELITSYTVQYRLWYKWRIQMTRYSSTRNFEVRRWLVKHKGHHNVTPYTKWLDPSMDIYKYQENVFLFHCLWHVLVWRTDLDLWPMTFKMKCLWITVSPHCGLNLWPPKYIIRPRPLYVNTCVVISVNIQTVNCHRISLSVTLTFDLQNIIRCRPLYVVPVL